MQCSMPFCTRDLGSFRFWVSAGEGRPYNRFPTDGHEKLFTALRGQHPTFVVQGSTVLRVFFKFRRTFKQKCMFSKYCLLLLLSSSRMLGKEISVAEIQIWTHRLTDSNY